jgi:NDP-sugar pyrophosphorylase family protein
MLAGPKAMTLIRRLASPRNTDLMSHLVPRLLQSGARVAAYYTKSDWFDVGTVSSFENLNKELEQHPLGRLA